MFVENGCSPCDKTIPHFNRLAGTMPHVIFCIVSLNKPNLPVYTQESLSAQVPFFSNRLEYLPPFEGLKFLPTVRAAWTQSKTTKAFIFDRVALTQSKTIKASISDKKKRGKDKA